MTRAAMGRKARTSNERNEAAAKGMTPWQLRAVYMRRRRIMSAGYRRRSSLAELSLIVEGSNVRVTKCPPGCHSGWKPSWL